MDMYQQMNLLFETAVQKEEVLIMSKQYQEWKVSNPLSIKAFYTLAAQAAQARNHYGISGIAERVRWHMNIEKAQQDLFKINNNHRAFIARELMDNKIVPEGFFELRKSKCDE